MGSVIESRISPIGIRSSWGVSYDSTEANKSFKEKFDFPYDLLSDLDKAATVAYGVAAPEDERPSRKSVLIGPDKRIAASYDTVKPAEHPDQVLADLDKLT